MICKGLMNMNCHKLVSSSIQKNDPFKLLGQTQLSFALSIFRCLFYLSSLKVANFNKILASLATLIASRGLGNIYKHNATSNERKFVWLSYTHCLITTGYAAHDQFQGIQYKKAADITYALANIILIIGYNGVVTKKQCENLQAGKNKETNPLFLSVSSLSASISLVATTFVVMQFKKQAIPWICLTSGVVDTVLHKNLWDQKNPQSIPFKLLRHTSIYFISGLLVRGTISDEQNINQVACFLQLVAAMLYQLTCYNTGINYRKSAKVVPEN